MNVLKLLLSLLLISPLSATVDGLVKETTQFAFSLYDEIRTDNVFISPYATASCLQMTYLGARADTASEMQKALYLSSSGKALPEYANLLYKELTDTGLKMANGMWLAPKALVLTDYRRLLEKEFHAHLATVEPEKPEEAARAINAWAADEMQDRIETLVQPEDVNGKDAIVLTSAAYYQGAWLNPFDLKKTKRETFHVTASQSEEVDMMEQTGLFNYCKEEGFESVALAFRDTTVVCLLMRPRGSVINPENALERALQGQKRTRVTLKLPRFGIRQRLSLSKPLQELGMRQAFSSQADFSGVNGLQNLVLGTVVHEAFLELNEEGIAVAGEATASMGLTGVLDKAPPVSLTFDHPFLFWIIDMNTKTVLFMGRYTCSSCPGS